MADEIKLKAPTVEQQVVIKIDGEKKLEAFADTLDKMAKGRDLHKYWKDQESLIKDTVDAFKKFNKVANTDTSSELLKTVNALKAMGNTDISSLSPELKGISTAIDKAEGVAGNLVDAFSERAFKEAFDSFKTLRAYGTDIEKLFSHFGVSSDVNELQKNVRLLENEVGKLTRRLTSAKEENIELRNEFENFKTGSGFADKLEELDDLKEQMSSFRSEAEETFRQFLRLNNISEDGYDRYGDYENNRFESYFRNIRTGYYSASDAVREFKREYSYLLEDSFKSNNDTFGLEQLQLFSNKLDSIFRQVEDTSNKINEIISNGVIAKSVENLSTDPSLTDPQRSLFGNLLQDEESLKSITALFQKLIDESNKTSNVNIFDEKQLEEVLSILDSIDKSLLSLKSIISDVGDGEEFSPLLKMINEVKEATANIKLNFNMDFGDEVSERLNQKISQAISRQLEGYRNLFSAMKKTKKTNSEMLKFFEPDDASVTELIGMYKGIIERAEKQFKVGNSNVYKKILGSEYDALKREIANANKQLSRADNKRSENGILGDLFGKTDLSEVLEQLGLIVEKLGEISKTVSGFKDEFNKGFNVTTSIEEIDKLTSRVKELEEELAKVKLNPVDSPSVKSSAPENEKPETSGMEQISTAIEEAVQAKNAFATANENVQESVEESKSPLQVEAELMGQIAKSAREAADAKKEFVEANKKVKDSANDSNKPLNKDKYKDRVKVSDDEYDSEKFASIANQKLIDNGYTILGDSVSTELVDGLVKVNAKIKTVDGSWKSFSAKIDADGNVFEQRFRTITKNINKLNAELEEFGNDDPSTNASKKENKSIEDLRTSTELFDEAKKRLGECNTELGKFDKLVSNPDGTSTITFLKDLEDRTQAVSIKVKDLSKFIDDLETGAIDEKSIGSYRIGVKDRQVAQAYNTLSKTEEDIWNLTVKNLNGTVNQEQIEKLAEISALRDKAIKIIEGTVAATEKEIEAQQKWIEIQEKVRNKVEGFNDAETSKKELLNMSSEMLQRMSSDANKQNIDGFYKVIDHYRDKVKELNDALMGSEYSTKVADKYKKDLYEIERALKNTVVANVGFDEAESEMRKYFESLKANSLTIEKFDHDNRTLTATYVDQNKMLHKVTLGYDDLTNSIKSTKHITERAKSSFESFFDGLKGRLKALGQYLLSFASFYDIVNKFQYGFQVVRDLDTAYTEMIKVSDESERSLRNFQEASFDVAKQVGVTAKTIQESTADWMRLGESLDEAAESAKVANILLNVSEFDNIDDATTSLVAMSQAYQELDKIDIVDKLNIIGNNFSVATDDLATGLQNVAAVLKTQGNDLNQAIALVTAGNAITQDISKTSAGVRTIALRIAGTEEAKNELVELGESVDDFVVSTKSKTQKLIKDYTAVASNAYKGVDVLDPNGNLRNTFDILSDIADVYKEIQELDKKTGTNRANALIEYLAGKNRSNIAASILLNPEMLKDVYETSLNESAGSAEKELNKYLDSIEGRLNLLTSQTQEFWTKVINSDLIKEGITLLTELLELATDLVDNFGVLSTLFTVGSGVLGFRGSGLTNYVTTS